MPTRPTTLTIDRADLAGSFAEAKLDFRPIGIEMLTPTPVPKERGNFGVIPIEALLQRADTRRKARSGYNRTDWELDQDSYDCKENGHEEVVDDSERVNYADIYDYEKVLAMRGRRILAQEQEIRIKDLLHNTTTFPLSGNTGLDTSTVWATVASATPIADVNAAHNGIRARCGMKGNFLQINLKTHRYLSRTAEILDVLKYTKAPVGLLPTEELAAVFGVDEVIVADMMYNSAKQGQAASLSEIWSDSYAFVGVKARTADIAETCLGRTFVQETDGGLLTVESYRDETKRADVLRTRQKSHEKVIYTACGFLLKID